MRESKAILLHGLTPLEISPCYRLRECTRVSALCTPRGRLDFAENSNAEIVSIPQIGASADHSNYASALFALARENSWPIVRHCRGGTVDLESRRCRQISNLASDGSRSRAFAQGVRILWRGAYRLSRGSLYAKNSTTISDVLHPWIPRT